MSVHGDVDFLVRRGDGVMAGYGAEAFGARRVIQPGGQAIRPVSQPLAYGRAATCCRSISSAFWYWVSSALASLASGGTSTTTSGFTPS